MRAVQAGPVTGLIAQVLLLAALAGTVGLSGAGWVVGVTCGVITNAALARGLSRYRVDRLGPADWVTLARATLAVGVAALVADSFDQPAPVTLLVTLTVVALALDAVDGWVARRNRTASTFGAHFDGEVDAFLILVLSVYVARSTGAWVLAIGAARYAFLAAGWLLPWMREPLPPRYWRKVVAATQGIVLTIAAADVLPQALTQAALVVALALLCRVVRPRHVVAVDATGTPAVADRNAAVSHTRGRVRTSLAAALTILAILVVWVALVAPDHPSRLTPSAFVRLPLEGLVVIALALVLPATPRRVLAWVVGPLLGLLVIVKILDMGFFTTFDRPFDPIADWSYTGIGIETLRDSVGSTDANLVVAAAAVLVVGVLVLTTLAVLRLTRVAAGHRRWSLRAVAALGVVWVLCWAFGAQLVSHAPIASTSAAGLVVDEVRAVRAGIRDHAIFADEIRHDRLPRHPRRPAADRPARQGRHPRVRRELRKGRGPGLLVLATGRCRSRRGDEATAGRRLLRAERLPHLVDVRRHQLAGALHACSRESGSTASGATTSSSRADRFTLSQAFKRAGWRTVDDVPSNDRDWPQGSSFYHYDKVYDRRNVGYRGPRFAYASMPDQYVFLALQRLELAKRDRRPLFAEVDLVSSHAPWTRIPELIDWSDVGDGSVFNRIPVDQVTTAALWSDPERVRAAYGRSIEYTLNTLISFVQHYGDDNLVLVVLGDHQPATIVTGRTRT